MSKFIDIFRQHFNLEGAEFIQIEHTNAMVAEVYEVVPSIGEKLILKVCPKAQHFFRELYFLKKMKGIVPIPKMIQVFEPENGIPGAILMEYLTGNLLDKDSLTSSLAYEIGGCLAKIHSTKLNGYGDLIAQADLSSSPEKHWLEKLDESINECRGHIADELIEQAYKYIRDNIYLLRQVDGPCIVHRDFRPGNIIINQGKLSGIIDWASARASFSQEDFQTFEQQEWSADSGVNKAFIEGYSSIRQVPCISK